VDKFDKLTGRDIGRLNAHLQVRALENACRRLEMCAHREPLGFSTVSFFAAQQFHGMQMKQTQCPYDTIFLPLPTSLFPLLYLSFSCLCLFFIFGARGYDSRLVLACRPYFYSVTCSVMPTRELDTLRACTPSRHCCLPTSIAWYPLSPLTFVKELIASPGTSLVLSHPHATPSFHRHLALSHHR
jgi:hypothetical protein